MRTSLKQFGMTFSALLIGAAVAPRLAKAAYFYEDQGNADFRDTYESRSTLPPGTDVVTGTRRPLASEVQAVFAAHPAVGAAFNYGPLAVLSLGQIAATKSGTEAVASLETELPDGLGGLRTFAFFDPQFTPNFLDGNDSLRLQIRNFGI